jgi:hypothetical protein
MSSQQNTPAPLLGVVPALTHHQAAAIEAQATELYPTDASAHRAYTRGRLEALSAAPLLLEGVPAQKPEGLLFMEWAEDIGLNTTRDERLGHFLSPETATARATWRAALRATSNKASAALPTIGEGGGAKLTLTGSRWVYFAETPELKEQVNALFATIGMAIPADNYGPRYRYVMWNGDKVDALYSDWTKPRWGMTQISFQQLEQLVKDYASAPTPSEKGSNV